MPRGIRKPASDSIHAELESARAPDVSTISAPEIAGSELLGDVGRDFYETLWRSESARWSTADLHLILDSALIHQELHTARQIASMTPSLHTFGNGTVGRHPQHSLVADLAKRLSDNLRALGARSRDGAKAASLPTAPTNTASATNGDILTFEDYLNAGD